MAELKVAFFGENGHQISHAIAKTPRARLVGVAGVDEARFEALRKELPEAYSQALLYGSLGKLLGKSGAELVSICSARRDEQHRHIVAALRGGLHVFAEKPLAVTMRGLDAVAEAAAKYGRVLRVMTGMIYAPAYRKMREVVASGALGAVVQAFAQKSYPYHDQRPQDRGVDGGLIEQAAVHAVSFVRYVTGLEFEELTARESSVGNPVQGGGLQMAAQISARMTGGALCAIVANYCNPKGVGFWGNDQLRVHGTRGFVESVDGNTRSLLALADAKPGPLELPAGKAEGDPLFTDFVSHLLDRTPMLLSQADSIMNTRVVIRAQESATRGRTLSV